MMKTLKIYKTTILFLGFLLHLSISAQTNLVDFNTIPKEGTILVYAHQDDDLIWMYPFWEKTEKFIGGAMPSTPVFETIIQLQQDYLDSHGYDIDYLSNWITPWGPITHDQYQQYYWNNNTSYWYLAADHLTSAYAETETSLVRKEINRIKAKLEPYISSPDVSRIITHNVWGEYGHIHHKAVCQAVRELAVKYSKDVWMLGADNGRFNDISVPSGIKYTVAPFDDAAMFIAIRDIYISNGCWTWSSVVVNDSHKYIEVVEAGNDKSGYLTGEGVTVTGPAQSEPGAYIFDGVDDYITKWGNKNASFTISMRIKPDLIKEMDISKLAEYHSSTLYDRNFSMNADGSITASINDGGVRNVTSTTKLAAGVWSHIAMTSNGSNLKIYINGVLENTLATGSAISVYESPELVLGMATKTASYFKGQLNDVEIYDRTLTDSEIGVLSGRYFNITAEAGSGGTINPSGSILVSAATDKSFNITPNSGYFISDVLIDGSSVGAVSSYTFNTVTSNHTISATFNRIIYTITGNSGSNGSISPSGGISVNHGDNITFNIAPDYGYRISSVVVDGNYAGTNSTYTFNNVQANHTISALFVSKPTYQIVSNAGSGGSVSPSGNITVYESDSQKLTFTPDDGYRIADVIIDGSSVGAVSTYTFSNITANHTVSVSFEAIPSYTIDASAAGDGVINPAGAITVYEGTEKSFSISANIGFRIQNVLVDDISVGTVSSYTFQNIRANHTIHVTFMAIPTYTIISGSNAGGSIIPSGSTTVNESTNKTYSISADAGYRIKSVTVDGISEGPVSSYSFSNILANHTINVTFEAIPQYSITSSASQGGNINPTGTLKVYEGSGQAYTMTPVAGYYLADVLVNNSSIGPVTSYSFENVTADKTIRANFAIYSYIITASAGTGGTISYAGQHTVNYNDNITYHITPNAGYQISNVKVDNISVGVVSDYTFYNVKETHTISVTFIPVTFIIYANTGAGGSISPQGDVIVQYGTSQTFAINAFIGYHITNVIVDDISKGAVSSYTFNNVTADHDIAVEYLLNTYTITASAGANGTISPSGNATVEHGSELKYTLTGNPGYEVSDVLVDNVSVGAISTYTFKNITSGHTISATFKTSVYTITSSSGSGGSISPSGAATFHYGENYTCSITPDVGFQINDILVDNVSVGALTTYTFSNISASHTIRATFKPITYIIAGTAGPHGSISPQGNTVTNYGSNLTYTITSNTGYHISDVLVDNIPAGVISTYTFSNITSNHTIAATFAINTYTISSSSGAGGSVNPSGTSTLNYGDNATYTITPSTGYQVSDVLVDNTSVGPLSTYTFNNISAGHTISAVFSPITFTITSTGGQNGTISPSGTSTMNYGTDFVYQMIPDQGYKVSEVLIDGTPVGSVSTYVFRNITSNHTISVLFKIADFTITGMAETGGTISPSGAVGYNYGDNGTYTFTPDTGYEVKNVFVDNVSVGAVSSYTFEQINADHTISVTFKLLTFNIKAISGNGGVVSPTGITTLNYGTDQTYHILPDDGYKTNDVRIDNLSLGVISEYTFENIKTSHEISATFALIPLYNISSSAGKGGSIYPSGTITIREGSDKTYQAIPDPGYRILNIFVDGMPADAVTEYTFNDIDGPHSIAATFTTDNVVRMYPNPFKQEFVLFIQSQKDLRFDLTILNIEEKLIGKFSDIRGNFENLIDIGPVPPGVYIAQLYYEGSKIKTFRIVKY